MGKAVEEEGKIRQVKAIFFYLKKGLHFDTFVFVIFQVGVELVFSYPIILLCLIVITSNSNANQREI